MEHTARARYMYADVDHWSDTNEERWQEMLDVSEDRWEAVAVASGSGGRHLYVSLPAPVEPEVLTEWNRGLKDRFGGDSKFHANALLRVPGSYNHKARVRGTGPSTRVVIL